MQNAQCTMEHYNLFKIIKYPLPVLIFFIVLVI